MRAAFYKGTRPGLPGIYNRLVRWWTRSAYSHCELVFRDGLAASASFSDGGVRFKRIDFDPGHWDIFELPDAFELRARVWFEQHAGQKYDLLGNLHFVFAPVGDAKQRWFCSESAAAALGFANPARFDPGTLFSALTIFNNVPASAGFFTP